MGSFDSSDQAPENKGTSSELKDTGREAGETDNPAFDSIVDRPVTKEDLLQSDYIKDNPGVLDNLPDDWQGPSNFMEMDRGTQASVLDNPGMNWSDAPGDEVPAPPEQTVLEPFPYADKPETAQPQEKAQEKGEDLNAQLNTSDGTGRLDGEQIDQAREEQTEFAEDRRSDGRIEEKNASDAPPGLDGAIGETVEQDTQSESGVGPDAGPESRSVFDDSNPSANLDELDGSPSDESLGEHGEDSAGNPETGVIERLSEGVTDPEDPTQRFSVFDDAADPSGNLDGPLANDEAQDPIGAQARDTHSSDRLEWGLAPDEDEQNPTS